MRRAILMLALVLAPTVGAAQDISSLRASAHRQRDEYGVIIPPARFASGPLPRVEIKLVSMADLPRLCWPGSLEAQRNAVLYNTLACATPTPTVCHILIAEEIETWNLHESLLRHELAHCRGWGGDHAQDEEPHG